MSANDTQVGGSHYQKSIQVWDFIAANKLDYFQGNIIKYVTRFREKGGVADLEKAKHYLKKLIEMELQGNAAQDLTAWTPWDGGENPVEYGKEVELKLRCGQITSIVSHLAQWDHESADWDILAYRVLP